MEQTQKINRIPSVVAGLMVSVAILIDLLQFGLAFIPLAGWFLASAVACMAFLTFFLWFKFRGVSYNSTRKIAVSGIGFLVEFIPLLNAAPAWTLSISLMILIIKGEDLLENEKNKLKPKYSKQKPAIRTATNKENYGERGSQSSNLIPINASQNPRLINRDFKGIASSDDSSRFIKAA